MRWFGKRSEAERRRKGAELLYDLEVEYRKVGWGDPAYVHNEEGEPASVRMGATPMFVLSARKAAFRGFYLKPPS